MGADEVARRRVVLANDLDELLWLGRLGKGREPAEVEVGDGDIGAVAGKELLALVLETSAATSGERNLASSAFCRSTVSNSSALAIAIALWSANVAMSDLTVSKRPDVLS